MKKIALYGGAFNPPTKGHQQLAELISNYFDEVWIMPCNNHLFKPNLISNENRLYMLNLIDFKKENIIISDFEIKSKLTGKLYETLEILKTIYKDYSFHIVLGSDNLNNIKTFFNYENLIKENNFCIIERKGFDLSTEIYNSLFLENKNNIIIENKNNIMEISSSYIRENIKNDNISNYIDENVLNFIKKQKLYSI